MKEFREVLSKKLPFCPRIRILADESETTLLEVFPEGVTFEVTGIEAVSWGEEDGPGYSAKVWGQAAEEVAYVEATQDWRDAVALYGCTVKAIARGSIMVVIEP